MQIELRHQPSSTAAFVTLEPGDALTAESGALMALKGNVQITTTTHQKKGGGIGAGIKRLLSGESFFLNHYHAQSPAEVWLCSPLPGDMMVHELRGEQLVVAGGAYVACDNNVHINLEWQGLVKGIFSGESLFWLKAKGEGKLLLNSFGFIIPIDVEDEFIVDTGHIVAFEETLDFTISKSSTSWISSFLSGEGLVCHFKGRGKIWCQSHNPDSYGKSLTPFLKPRK